MKAGVPCTRHGVTNCRGWLCAQERARHSRAARMARLVWWAIGMAHEHRDRSARAARRGDWAEAGRHYGEALGCYDSAQEWTTNLVPEHSAGTS